MREAETCLLPRAEQGPMVAFTVYTRCWPIRERLALCKLAILNDPPVAPPQGVRGQKWPASELAAVY
jgi:hypothetical protein